MTIIKTKTRLEQVMDDLSVAKIMDRILYLKDRWQDEREYEDFAEYETAIINLFIDTPYEVASVTRGFAVNLVEKANGANKYRAKFGFTKLTVERRK
jgi:hypothetical protein